MEQRIKQIRQQLSAHNYKLTPQREATVQVLLENREDHLSAEDVYLLVKKISPVIGLATVYRTLELLSELGIIYKLNFGDGVYRYEIPGEGVEHHHHHLFCLQCGRVDEVFEDLLEPIEEHIENQYNFNIVGHHLTFHGICTDCKNRSSKNSKDIY